MIDAALAAPLAGGFLALDSSDTWVLAAFLMFLGLLAYLGVPGMLGKALDDRAEAIRNQLNEARKLREEAQRKLAEFERKHAEVERQAEQIVERAKQEAEAAGEEAKKSIEESVARRLQSAEEQIAMAEADVLREVRNTAVDAAVAATRKVLSNAIGSQEHSTLLDSAIKETARRAN